MTRASPARFGFRGDRADRPARELSGGAGLTAIDPL